MTNFEQTPQQEPVGQLMEEAYGRGQVLWFHKPHDLSMLYTLPPSKPWVGLTDAEIARVVSLAGFAPDWAEANIATQIVRVCQNILKEKNT